jgi:hypothetical protein
MPTSTDLTLAFRSVEIYSRIRLRPKEPFAELCRSHLDGCSATSRNDREPRVVLRIMFCADPKEVAGWGLDASKPAEGSEMVMFEDHSSKRAKCLTFGRRELSCCLAKSAFIQPLLYIAWKITNERIHNIQVCLCFFKLVLRYRCYGD